MKVSMVYKKVKIF